jgi:hypothetical protein
MQTTNVLELQFQHVDYINTGIMPTMCAIATQGMPGSMVSVF